MDYMNSGSQVVKSVEPVQPASENQWSFFTWLSYKILTIRILNERKESFYKSFFWTHATQEKGASQVKKTVFGVRETAFIS